MTRPSKKSTVEELRVSLSAMGLETKGKKETLWRRIISHFKRSSPPKSDQSDTTKDLDESAPASREAGAAQIAGAGPSEKLGSGGLSAKQWGKQPCRSFLCFDVEATCRGGKEFDWPNEIIEFPVVLLRWAEDVEPSDPDTSQNTEDRRADSQAGPSKLPPSLAALNTGRRLIIVDTFQSYVRPTWQPKLTDFCTRFTGITQEMVDASPTFPEVLKLLEAWMDGHRLRVDHDGEQVEGLVGAIWVTDGVSLQFPSRGAVRISQLTGQPWDLRDFISKQLHITPCTPSYPLYLRQPYLNIKQAFQTVLSEEFRREQYALSHPGQLPKERATSRITTSKLVGQVNQEKLKGLGFYGDLPSMLKKLGLGEFKGRRHCGLDDATNVARILQVLAEKDVLIESNARLPPPKNAKKWAWMGKPGEVIWEEWMSDNKRPNGDKFGSRKPEAEAQTLQMVVTQRTEASETREERLEERVVAEREGPDEGEGDGEKQDLIGGAAENPQAETSSEPAHGDPPVRPPQLAAVRA